MGSVDDVAEACCYLASDAAVFINGQTIRVSGGQYMFKPRRITIHLIVDDAGATVAQAIADGGARVPR